MLHTDIAFASQLSAVGFRNFKHISQYVWRFSCPYCGDSHKIKTKARGFILRGTSGLYYKCQNCGISVSFSNFLKEHATHLFREYLLESYKNKKEYEKLFENTPKIDENISKIRLEKLPYATPLAALPIDHFCLLYAKRRKIPSTFYDKIYFIKEFKAFADNLKPGCIENLKNDHPRLVIPFYDENGKIFAFQGRALGKEIPKYLTIKLDETTEKLFGIERLDESKEIFVTEGPIDSMFIPNCIAVAGGAVNSKFLIERKNNVSIIFDNEPRNDQICKQIEKCITIGFKVVLLPKSYRDMGKDLNDLVLAGVKNLETIIKNNTYSGMLAKIKYSEWRTLK